MEKCEVSIHENGKTTALFINGCDMSGFCASYKCGFAHGSLPEVTITIRPTSISYDKEVPMAGGAL